MNHTAGPWTYNPSRNMVHHLQYQEPLDELRNGICQMIPNRNPETIANAALIAAAPELLEALKIDLKRVEELETMIPQQAGMWAIWAKDIRSAIAKAAGRG
jgi:hypothetical protein